MPLLKFKITSNIDDETRVELAVAMTEITERLLRKSPALTAIIIEKFSPDSWTVGGKTLRSQNLNSFCLEIAVTEATNTKAEFASFIDSVFAKMTEKLGPLHEASYVIVNEVPAHAWGFAGRTQEHRFIATQFNAATA